MKRIVLFLAMVVMIVVGANAQYAASKYDAYIPLSTTAITNFNETYTGVAYGTSLTHKLTKLPAWQYDSIQYVIFFQDSVHITGVKILRYIDGGSTQSVADSASSTADTLTSTSSSGKFLVIMNHNAKFLKDQSATAGYQALQLEFAATQNPYTPRLKKYFVYAHVFYRH